MGGPDGYLTRIDVCNHFKVLPICQFWTLEIFTMKGRDIKASSGRSLPVSVTVSCHLFLQSHVSHLISVCSDHQSASGIVSSTSIVIIISIIIAQDDADK